MRSFDTRDELRATADRRKQPQAGGAPAALRGEGIAQIAARLVVMFPALPQDTVEAVLSQLFRADASLSREQLADRAVCALLDMSVADGAPQCVTSYEPRCTAQANRSAACPAEVVDLTGPQLAGQSHGPSASQALQGLDAGGAASILPSTAMDVSEAGDAFDELLDENLALLLGLPDEDLSPCVRTLVAILDRIAQEPENQRVRRLRLTNAKFETTVGRHDAAVDLLRLAGFADDMGDGAEDRAVGFFDDPNVSTAFLRVRESLAGVLEELSAQTPAAPASKASAAPVPQRAPAAPGGRNLRGHRRQHIAELTEQRLRDPRGFREQAARTGAANRSVGGRLPRPQQRTVLDRRSQHFTMADIERRRIADEIASTPSYAEEYRRNAHAAPVHDYGSLVARSYDLELIARQALDATNAYRATKGLPPCRWDDRIAPVAAEHAAQMASGAAPFNHDGFDARVAAFRFSHRGAAENLAWNQGISDVARAAVDGWIKSPGHERNLRGNYNLCGIGAAKSRNGAFYLTQLFALA